MTGLKIGLIGFGFIGKNLFDALPVAAPELIIDFVFDRDPARLQNLRPSQRLDNLTEIANLAVDLVVEAAHPDVTQDHGIAILQSADYLPLSLTALADDELYDGLQKTAAQFGKKLFIPHGATIGLDGIFALRDRLQHVTITTVKPAANLDHSVQSSTLTAHKIVYDGPTRAACRLYPRSVNSHAAVALAGIGFDHTRSILIEDPTATHTQTDIVCQGTDIDFTITRRNPMQGVSSQMMPQMVLASLLTALRQNDAVFC